MHDGLGGSCGDGNLQDGCAVERGASYDALIAGMTVERHASLIGMICRPMLRAGMTVQIHEFVVSAAIEHHFTTEGRT
jgi:hypothetical protein